MISGHPEVDDSSYVKANFLRDSLPLLELLQWYFRDSENGGSGGSQKLQQGLPHWFQSQSSWSDLGDVGIHPEPCGDACFYTQSYEETLHVVDGRFGFGALPEKNNNNPHHSQASESLTCGGCCYALVIHYIKMERSTISMDKSTISMATFHSYFGKTRVQLHHIITINHHSSLITYSNYPAVTIYSNYSL